MESAVAWIGAIFNWLGAFIPRWVIIDSTHAAVKFVRGSRVVACAAGIIWYWPVTTNLVLHPIARQTANLKSQTIMTSDERTVIVGGLIVFEISDIEKVLAHTFDPDETIKDICLSTIHDVCCQLTWTELHAEQRSGALDRKLRAEAKKDLDRYGVRVIKMTLTDLAPCRVLKLLNAMSQD